MHYESIRRISIDDAVEPAFMFQPFSRAARPGGSATPHAKLVVDRPRFARRPADDDLAFLPLTALAALVESRQVSSTEDEFSGTARTRETDAERVDENRRQEQRRVLNDALAALTRAGAKLKPITLPDIPAAALYSILNAEAGAAFDDLVRAGRVGELTGKGPNDRANQLRVSPFIPAVEYIRAQRARTILGERMDDVMSTCDVFLAPSTSSSVTISNLTGHPAVTVNAGFAGGLPVGLMITGRLYDESTVLAAALAYERACGPLDQRPPLATH